MSLSRRHPIKPSHDSGQGSSADATGASPIRSRMIRTTASAWARRAVNLVNNARLPALSSASTLPAIPLGGDGGFIQPFTNQRCEGQFCTKGLTKIRDHSIQPVSVLRTQQAAGITALEVVIPKSTPRSVAIRCQRYESAFLDAYASSKARSVARISAYRS